MIQPVGKVVHVRVPERAAVGIERHRTVVTPSGACRTAAVANLRTCALNLHLLGLRQGVNRIRRKASGIFDRRLRGAAGSAVAQRHVSRTVDGETGHEAMNDIRAVRIERGALRGRGSDAPAVDTDLVVTRRRKAGRVASSY